MKNRTQRHATILAVAGLFLALPNLAHAVGQEVGRIEGQVTEAQTAAPVPGATITLTGPALIGPPRQTQTDEEGHYEIANLPTGVYDVEVSYQGVKPIMHRVAVEPSATTPLNIAWSAELAETQTTVVIEERHLTKPDSPMAESVFSVAKFDYLPIARQYQNTMQQAPGVIGTGNANVKGSTQRQNKFMIDGMDITDPVTNTFRGNWQFDATDSIQVITGGMEAKYNAIGAVTNLITRSGSDELHFNVSGFYRPDFLTDFNAAGRQSFDGTRPFSIDPKPPSKDYDVSFVVDGPIIKHKLWYSASFRYAVSQALQPPGPPLNMQAPTRVSTIYQPRLKLNWAPSASHRIIASVFGDPTKFDFVNNNGSQANIAEPLAAFTQNQGGWHVMAEWDYFISQVLDTKVLAGFQRSGITAGPQGKVNGLDPKYGIYDFDRPRHQNRTDNSVWGNCCIPGSAGNASTYSVDGRPKFQFDASVTWRPKWLGSHEFESGFQGLYSHFTQRSTPTGRGVSYIDAPNPGTAAAPLNQGLCDDDPNVQPDPALRTGAYCFQRTTTNGFETATYNYSFGVYLQDRWKPLRWLTILPGLRWDRYEDRLKRDDPNVPLPYGERVLTYGFGPRFAVITDLTGDQKTILQVSYGRATQPVYATTLTTADTMNKQTTVTETWRPSSTPGTPPGGSFVNPVQSSGAGSSFLDTAHHTPPHSDEFLVRFSRELFGNSVVEIEYTYKKVSNILTAIETNRIWDPSGNRVIGYVDPTKTFPITVATYPDDAYSKYSGLSLSFASRPSQNLDFQGSYTLAYTYGPAYEDNLNPNPYSNPRQAQYFSGFAPGVDRRHFFKTTTSYRWEGVIVGVLFNWASGQALTKTFTSNAGLPTRYRSPIGTEPGVPLNNSASWTEFRTPDFFNLGITIGYDFYSLIRQHLILSAAITNVLNLSTPNAFNTADNDLFGTVSARETSRRATLGLRYQY